MKIIVALDDSPSSNLVVYSVLNGHWPEDLAFKIVTVLEPVCVSFEDVGITEFAQTALEIYENRKDNTRNRCEQICKNFESVFPQANVSYEIKDGAPWVEIVREAQAWPADSILVGTSGEDGHNRHGSVSRAIAEHAPCQVTVI